jgi:hypothetical protein
MELIYNYSYSTKDILRAIIKIYKQDNNEYILFAEFTVYEKISLPKTKTIYQILESEEEEICEEKLITIKRKIKIMALSNPRPEQLFIIY